MFKTKFYQDLSIRISKQIWLGSLITYHGEKKVFPGIQKTDNAHLASIESLYRFNLINTQDVTFQILSHPLTPLYINVPPKSFLGFCFLLLQQLSVEQSGFELIEEISVCYWSLLSWYCFGKNILRYYNIKTGKKYNFFFKKFIQSSFSLGGKYKNRILTAIFWRVNEFS